MNSVEYKKLCYDIVPKLKEKFAKSEDTVEVVILQDTLFSKHPFGQNSVIIGIGYNGTTVRELYQVNNNGEECSWNFIGNSHN